MRGLACAAALAAALACAGCSLPWAGESASDFEKLAESFEEASLDLDYTDRDMDWSYSEDEAINIGLSETTASCSSKNVEIDGSTVTITKSGVYVISGSLTDGQLVVAAGDDAKVQLVLNDASVSCSCGPALYVKEAKKCFVTTLEGTENALSDAVDYELDNGEDSNAAIYSLANLTFNGAGTLSVAGNSRHGVYSKDDLVITGGTLSVTAQENGLVGHDCVKIGGGNVTVVAGKDGVKSNKSSNVGQGYVSMSGGSVSVQAGDDGIQAVVDLVVSGGELSVNAQDRALQSALQMSLEGGSVTVASGNDAFHAETVLTVNGGSITATSCYEGLEAEKVYINDGTVDITAADDAINASTADLTNSEDADDEQAGQSQQAGPGGAGGMVAADGNCLVQINGGSVTLNSSGDAVDSNGNVKITGGLLLANGPASDGESAFDYDGEATISGGTVLMLGRSGMAQSFTEGEQRFSMQKNASVSAGDAVVMRDADGNVVCSLVATKNFNCILASHASAYEISVEP